MKKDINCGLILMYHRIADISSDPWGLCVTQKHFEEHLMVLNRSNRIKKVKVWDFSLLSKKVSSNPAVAITFDDGYMDNIIKAKPALQKYNLPATFYIVSGHIGDNREFWWDEVERLALKAKTLPGECHLNVSGNEYKWPVTSAGSLGTITGIPENGTPLSKVQLHAVLWRLVSDLSSEEKKTALHKIAEWVGSEGAPREGYLPMTSTDLKALADSPLFEIGAHTVTHPMLSRLSIDEQEREIKDSKLCLERMIGKEVNTFSYPHGDYTGETVDLVKRLGFDCACTVDEAPVLRDSDMFRLPRCKVLNWTGEEFERHLKAWIGQ